MAIPGDPMCGLHVVRKGHGHKAIYDFIEEEIASLQGTASSIETAMK